MRNKYDRYLELDVATECSSTFSQNSRYHVDLTYLNRKLDDDQFFLEGIQYQPGYHSLVITGFWILNYRIPNLPVLLWIW